MYAGNYRNALSAERDAFLEADIVRVMKLVRSALRRARYVRPHGCLNAPTGG